MINKIIGTQLNDILLGDLTKNWIDALGGNDILVGGNENDVLDGGSGNNTIKAGLGDDVIIVDGGDKISFVSESAANANTVGYFLPETGEAVVILENSKDADGFKVQTDIPTNAEWFIAPNAANAETPPAAGAGYTYAGNVLTGPDGNAWDAYDGPDQVKEIGGEILFEDIPGGGDRDFNDVVLEITAGDQGGNNHIQTGAGDDLAITNGSNFVVAYMEAGDDTYVGDSQSLVNLGSGDNTVVFTLNDNTEGVSKFVFGNENDTVIVDGDFARDADDPTVTAFFVGNGGENTAILDPRFEVTDYGNGIAIAESVDLNTTLTFYHFDFGDVA